MALLTLFGCQTTLDPSTLTGLELWLDSSDSSTVLSAISPDVVATNGDTVRQWSDKSGNGRHAVQSSSTLRPRYLSSQRGSKASIDFDGIDDFFTCGSIGNWNFLHNGTESSVFIVARTKMFGEANTIFTLVDTCDASSVRIGYSVLLDDTASLSRNNAGLSFVGRGSSGSPAVENLGSNDFAQNNFFMFCDLVDANNSTAANRSLMSFDNGTAVQNNTRTGAPSASSSFATLQLGRVSSGALFLLGQIAEVIILSNQDANQVAAVKSYLMRKWSIAGQTEYSATTAARISAGTSSYDAFPTIYNVDGDLMCLFRSGTNHVGSKGTITKAVSTDNGASWTVTANVLSHPTEDLRDPFGVVLANGNILIGNNINDYTPTPTPLGGYIWKSTDSGVSWTNISSVSVPSGFNYWFPFGKWVESGSTVYVPVYLERTSDSLHHSEVWKTEDEGLTFSKVSTIGTSYNETSIINTGGSNWLAVARAQSEATNRMAYFTSSDNMATWSSATLTDFPLYAVSPSLFEFDGSIWVAIGVRSQPYGIRFYKWDGSGFTDPVGNALLYRSTVLDNGYPSCVVGDDSKLHSVFYHQGTTPGIYYMRTTIG